MKLVCFPHSGASSVVYARWRLGMDPEWQLLAIDYPGHGRRSSESLIYDYDVLLANIYDHYKNDLQGPLWFFGHSLGGLVAFGLAQRLLAEGRDVSGLFISGRRPPSLPKIYPDVTHLDNQAFLEAVEARYGRLPQALYDPEFQRQFLPPLIADLTVSETHQWVDKTPVSCPLHVILATEDTSVALADIKAWFQHTTKPGDLIHVPGNHLTCMTNTKAFKVVLTEVIKRIRVT